MQTLESTVQEAVEAAGYSWEGQELLRHPNGDGLLRIFIDKPGGVTAEDCALASRQLMTAFQVAGIEENYSLEVSSPGLDRRLFTPEQMQRYVGQVVSIRLHSAQDGQRKWVGTLLSADTQNIEIETEEQTRQFCLQEVQWVRLVPQL